MAQALHGLGRAADPAAAASPHILGAAGIGLAHRRLTADRTFGREDEGYGVFRPALHHHTDDLRDHIAGALHDHRIADAHLLAGAQIGSASAREVGCTYG